MLNDIEVSIAEKAHELDDLFYNHAKIVQFNQFFSRNKEELEEIFEESICRDNLFSIEFVSAVAIPYVKSICKYLAYYGVAYRMRICASIIRSKEIPGTKKAMFWNSMVNTFYSWRGVPDSLFTQDVFMDNKNAREAFLNYQKDEEKSKFIRNTNLDICKNNSLDKTLTKGIQKDSVSIFEMNRQIAGHNITITMLQYLLNHEAVKCFIYLLAHFSKEVYKIRSAEEWLFTVCRNCPPHIAVPIIQYFEENKPGIVASTRDPWGNTLLWNTCANRWSICSLQKFLIELGCDPDEKNQWGLSFRLVQKNKLVDED